MPLSTWWTFAIAMFFISGTPGPSMLNMMASGMRHGLKPTFYAMAGCLVAILMVTTISVTGIGAVLQSSPRLFDILRCLGAAYLIYIGVQAIRQPGQGVIDLSGDTHLLQAATPKQHFKSGLMVGLSNPKLILFATAFFPQFIDKGRSVPPQFAILIITCCIIEFGWYVVYATGGSRIADYLSDAHHQLMLNRVAGALFVLFGVLLLCFHPA